MTNAIIRFLDKNPDVSKSSGERSVFCALGYECTAHESEPAVQARLGRDVDHFRVQHIMRSVDALRSVRLKELYRIQIEQRPHASPQDVLATLTLKLNALFVPSPSPPPIPTVTASPVMCATAAPAPPDSERSTVSTSPISSSSSRNSGNMNYSINHRHSANKHRDSDRAFSPGSAGSRERSLYSNSSQAQPAIYVTMSEPTPAHSTQTQVITQRRSVSASREQSMARSVAMGPHWSANASTTAQTSTSTAMDPLLQEQSRLLSQYALPRTGNALGLHARPEYLVFEDEVNEKFKRHCAKSAKAARKGKRMRLNEEAQQPNGNGPPAKRQRMGKKQNKQGKQGKRQKGRRKRVNPKLRNSLSPSVERQQSLRRGGRGSDNCSTDALDEEEDVDVTHAHANTATNSHARHVI